MADHTVTIVVLAGGRATRFPDKLSRHIGMDGEPLLATVVRRLAKGGHDCILSLREPLSGDLASLKDMQAVMDRYEDAGPLGGLATATQRVQTPLMFAVAGDLANIDATVLDELLERYRQECARGAAPDAIVPRHEDGRLEPLAALYDTATLRAEAVRVLASGRKKVTAVLEGMRVVYHDITSGRAMLYHNVNTSADLEGVIPR